MRHHILYHDHCADGFLSYVLARFAMESAGIRPEAIHGHPCTYGKPILTVKPEDLEKGDSVLMVDFSAPVEVMDAFAAAAGEGMFQVLDHHAGVPDEARARPYFEFSARAGCFMTYFRLARTAIRAGVPSVVELIEWRDLGGAWQEPDHQWSEQAHCVHAGLMRLLPRTYKAWLEMVIYESKLEKLMAQGAELRRRDARVVWSAAAFPTWVEIGGHVVPAVDGLALTLVSDACQALLNEFPLAPFAASWFVDAEGRDVVVSLRSRKGEMDVSEIARVYGGNGHACAAGFRTEKALKVVEPPTPTIEAP